MRLTRRFADPYAFDEKRYFNWHAGIRATNGLHETAERFAYYLRSREEAKKHGDIVSIGFDCAKKTREWTADALHCKPRNIFFANSATCAAIPILIALLYKHDVRTYYFSRFGQYPTISKYLLSDSCESEIAGVLTRQNFANSLDLFRPVPFHDIYMFLSGLVMPATNGGHISRLLGHKDIGSVVPLIVLEQFERSIGKVLSNETITEVRNIELPSGRRPFVLLDGSHTFGVIDSDIPALCDAYIASSSKGLAAEPTIGVAYVSDELLDLMCSVLPIMGYPRIALQFDPELPIGVKEDEAMPGMSWISMPELESFRITVFDIAESDRLNERKVHFEWHKRIFLEGAKELKLPLINRRYEEAIIKDAGEIPVSFSDAPNNLALIYPYSLAHEVASQLEKKGYRVGTLERNTILVDPEAKKGDKKAEPGLITNYILRISFSFEEGQDVQGLLQALECIL